MPRCALGPAAVALAAAIVLSGLLSSSASARPARVPRAAVVPSVLVNVNTNEGNRFVATIAEALSEGYLVDVVPAERIGEGLGSPVLATECLADAKCWRKVGTTLEIEYLLVVSVVRLGERLRISLTWIDMTASSPGQPVPIELAYPGDDLRDVFESRAATVIAGLDKRASEAPDQAEPADDATSENSSASEGTVADSEGVKVRTEPSGKDMLPIWALGGAGGVALIAGTVVGISAIRRNNDYDRACELGTCTESDRSAIVRRNWIADGLFLVGGGCIAAAAYLYFYADDGATGPSVDATRGGGTVGWRGVF